MTSPFQQLQDDPQFTAFVTSIVRTQLRAEFKTLSESQDHTGVACDDPEPNQPGALMPASEPTLQARLPAIFNVISLLSADKELQNRFLRRELAQDEEQQVEQILTISSHWERIEILWDTLKERVIERELPISEAEQGMLEFVLGCHNRLWVDRTASFVRAIEGEQYNYEKHFSVGQGDKVTALLLPGLLNSAGRLSRKPVVMVRG